MSELKRGMPCNTILLLSAINGVSRSRSDKFWYQNMQGLEIQRNSLWVGNIVKLEVAGTLEMNWRTVHCILALLLHPCPRHLRGRYQLQDTEWIFDPT